MFKGASHVKVWSGGAIGVDTEVIRVAKKLGYDTEEVLPKFKILGTPYRVQDYHDRNDVLISKCKDWLNLDGSRDIILAFWDGYSSGTGSVIEKASKLGKNIRIIYAE